MNKMYEWSCLYKDQYNTHNDTIIEIRCIKELLFYIDQYETDIQYKTALALPTKIDVEPDMSTFLWKSGVTWHADGIEPTIGIRFWFGLRLSLRLNADLDLEWSRL